MEDGRLFPKYPNSADLPDGILPSHGAGDPAPAKAPKLSPEAEELLLRVFSIQDSLNTNEVKAFALKVRRHQPASPPSSRWCLSYLPCRVCCPLPGVL